MVEITMQSGKSLPLSLNFGMLYKMRRDYPEKYKRYNYAMKHLDDKEEDSMFIIIDIIYTGYECAVLLDKKELTDENHKSYEEFLTELPDDMEYVADFGEKLIHSKKPTASDKLS